jgi:hypothetical protein
MAAGRRAIGAVKRWRRPGNMNSAKALVELPK